MLHRHRANARVVQRRALRAPRDGAAAGTLYFVEPKPGAEARDNTDNIYLTPRSRRGVHWQPVGATARAHSFPPRLHINSQDNTPHAPRARRITASNARAPPRARASRSGPTTAARSRRKVAPARVGCPAPRTHRSLQPSRTCSEVRNISKRGARGQERAGLTLTRFL